MCCVCSAPQKRIPMHQLQRLAHHRPGRRAVGQPQKRPGSIAPGPISSRFKVTMTNQTLRLLQVRRVGAGRRGDAARVVTTLAW